MNPDPELQALAAQEDLPADLIRRLLQHPDARDVVARRRRDLTEDMIAEIIALGSSDALAANSSLPAPVRARLAEHPDEWVRAAVAARAADDPPGLLDRLTQDPDACVRQLLAMNKHLTPAQRGRLAADPDPQVRSEVVQRWTDAPEPVRRAVLTDPDPGVRRCAVRAYTPPADLLPALLADPATRAPAVRYAGPLPELATDPDRHVREALAHHPDLPPGLRDILAEDPDLFVRNTIATRPDCPDELRERLLATLDTDNPAEKWLLSHRRTTHVCPPREAPLPALTHEEAEDLLARAGL